MPERRDYVTPDFLIDNKGRILKLDNSLSGVYPITSRSTYIIYSINEDAYNNMVKISYIANNHKELSQIPIEGYETLLYDTVVNNILAPAIYRSEVWSIKDQFRIQRQDEPQRNNTPSEEAFFEYLKSRIVI